MNILEAARAGILPLIVTLLNDGANIHTRDEEHYTPLIHAADEGHEVVQMLLANHANINFLPHNAVAIGLYEALRQQQFTQLACE